MFKIQSVFQENWDLTDNKSEEGAGIFLWLFLIKQYYFEACTNNVLLLSKHLNIFSKLFQSCLIIIREFANQNFPLLIYSPNLKPRSQGNPLLTLSLNHKVILKLYIYCRAYFLYIKLAANNSTFRISAFKGFWLILIFLKNSFASCRYWLCQKH